MMTNTIRIKMNILISNSSSQGQKINKMIFNFLFSAILTLAIHILMITILLLMMVFNFLLIPILLLLLLMRTKDQTKERST